MRMRIPILLILAAFVTAALDIDNDENENYMKIICHVQLVRLYNSAFNIIASNATTITAASSSSNSNNICISTKGNGQTRFTYLGYDNRNDIDFIFLSNNVYTNMNE
uniref:Uncharacterized protein n=1 Tax=Glossina austeni TaxID=7395 RepID=A0A1A9VH72_GLOAU